MTIFLNLNTPPASLSLPDGRNCMALDRFELAHALIAIGVPDVDASTGVADSLRAYSEHLKSSEADRKYSAQSAANDFVRETQEQTP